MIIFCTAHNRFSQKSHSTFSQENVPPKKSSLDCEAIVKGSTNFPLSLPADTSLRTLDKKTQRPSDVFFAEAPE